ncbi:MAG: hypothetical protein JWR77_759, partial [Rhizorhabdus sp.]|nr:hypothetical protein [Rhizorhabdus sp.]
EIKYQAGFEPAKTPTPAAKPAAK